MPLLWWLALAKCYRDGARRLLIQTPSRQDIMASRKWNRRRTRPQSQSPSIDLKLTEFAPQASCGPFLNTQYLLGIWRTHPMRPKSILLAFSVVSAIAFFLALAAAKGLLTQFILQLASENMSPRTAIVLGAACLWALSGVIAFRGPFTARSGRVYGIFGVVLPAIALTAWGSICGISIGALAAALVVGARTSGCDRACRWAGPTTASLCPATPSASHGPSATRCTQTSSSCGTSSASSCRVPSAQTTTWALGFMQQSRYRMVHGLKRLSKDLAPAAQ